MPLENSFGSEIRIAWKDEEVHLIFVAKSPELAQELVDRLLAQLKEGRLVLEVGGKPSSVTHSRERRYDA
jgi:hypothetical protein